MIAGDEIMPTDLNRLCLGCMRALPHPQATCPYCGWSRQTSQNLAGQLPQGITLTNPLNTRQYLIGKTVGQGGFGIVYTAWDIAGDRKVAIKEYFPKQYVSRDNSNTVILTSNSQNDKDFFDKQKKRFRQEAEKMQLFTDSPNVVTVLDFFDANNTSYIVMEFIEGRTFEHVLKYAPNQRLTLQDVLSNFQKVVDILERMHHTPWTDDSGKFHQGIIHRDISPENIMYASDGSVKLLDFGAARVAKPNDPTQVLKHGYAPYEQYLSIGTAAMQGPWTDVYAFAATIYRAITGQLSAKSFDRVNTNVDPLVLPSAFGIQITPAQEQVLLKGLAVDYHNRYQSVSQFYNDLVNAGKIIDDGGVIGGGGQTINKTVPMLTVSAFNKNGNNYIATINYNGDGMLTPSIGTINENILSVISADGNFNGVITASEGERFFAASVPFEHKEAIKTKAPWAAAAILLIAAVFSFGKMHNNQSELATLQNQISTERQQMERYQSFAADYGYASSSYYADKAIVFLSQNSKATFTIYCDLLKGHGDKPGATPRPDAKFIDGENIVKAKWASDHLDENNKVDVVVESGDKTGFATIHFTNKVNSDSFDVLIVVQ